MPRNLFTDEEIVLCAYAALYDEKEFGGINTIQRLTNRSRSSISMKIRNIAAKLEERGIPRNRRLSPLTGTATGEKARETNWDVVEPLTRIPQSNFQSRCRVIVADV